MSALKRDHSSGAVTAGLASIILVCAASVWTSPFLEWLVLVMVVADWVRLVLMIRRHEVLLTAGRSA